MAPKKAEPPPPEPPPEAEEPPKEEEPEEDSLVNREPVTFPPLDERIRGDGPIVIVQLDDPPDPKVETLLVTFLTAFFARRVEILAAPCMSAGIPPRAPKVKDLVLHMRKALSGGLEGAACVLGITQRALLDDDAPGAQSPFARVHGGAALLCTRPLGDRFDWSETFAFEKRFGRFSIHGCTKTKLATARVQDWQLGQTTPISGREVENKEDPSQRRRFLRRVLTLSVHTVARLFGLPVTPYDPDMPLWLGAQADIKILCGCEASNLKVASRPLTLARCLTRCDELHAVLSQVNKGTQSYRVGQRRFHEFDAECLWIEKAKKILESFFAEAACKAKWPDASFTWDLPHLYGSRASRLRDSPAFAEVVLQGWQLAYHEPTSFQKPPQRKMMGRVLSADLPKTKTCLADMQDVGGHHVELVSRTARQCFLAEPGPQYRTNDRMPHYYA